VIYGDLVEGLGGLRYQLLTAEDHGAEVVVAKNSEKKMDNSKGDSKLDWEAGKGKRHPFRDGVVNSSQNGAGPVQNTRGRYQVMKGRCLLPVMGAVHEQCTKEAGLSDNHDQRKRT